MSAVLQPKSSLSLRQLNSRGVLLAWLERLATLCSVLVLTYALVAGAAALPIASTELAGYSLGVAAASFTWQQVAATTSQAYAELLSPQLAGRSASERVSRNYDAGWGTFSFFLMSAAAQAALILAQIGLALFALLANLVDAPLPLSAEAPPAGAPKEACCPFPAYVLIVRIYLIASIAAGGVAAFSWTAHVWVERRVKGSAFKRYLHRAKLHALASAGFLGLPSVFASLEPAAFCAREVAVDLEHEWTWHKACTRWRPFVHALPSANTTQVACMYALSNDSIDSVAALLVYSLLEDNTWLARPGVMAELLRQVLALLEGGINIRAHNASEFLLSFLLSILQPHWPEKHRCILLQIAKALCECCSSFVAQGWPSPAPWRALIKLLDVLRNDSEFIDALPAVPTYQNMHTAVGNLLQAQQGQDPSLSDMERKVIHEQARHGRQLVWAAMLSIQTGASDADDWSGFIPSVLACYQPEPAGKTKQLYLLRQGTDLPYIYVEDRQKWAEVTGSE